MAAPWHRWDGAGLILHLKIQPRASRDEFAGIQGDRLKIRLCAPPVDGKANARLIEFLAEAFAVPKSRVILLAGAAGRDKQVRIDAPRVVPPEIGDI